MMYILTEAEIAKVKTEGGIDDRRNISRIINILNHICNGDYNKALMHVENLTTRLTMNLQDGQIESTLTNWETKLKIS